MRIVHARIAAFALTIVVAVFPSIALAKGTVFLNGHVYTPSGWREAIAIRDGKIAAVGSSGLIRARWANGSEIVDLKGRTVMPGLFDMHVHPMMAGNGEEGSCRIEQGATAQRLLAVLSACIKAAGPGNWVVGAQWQAISMGQTPITRQTLDAVSPENPVLLYDVSGHSMWVNSQALKVAGIVKGTPDPQGGLIDRDGQGEPTGVLHESAGALVAVHFPKPTQAQNVAALKHSLDLMLTYGITGLTDAMVFRNMMEAYDTLYDRGDLHQTARLCIAYSQAGKRIEGFDELLAQRASFARPRVMPDCVKMFADGVPTESHTAAMIEPYVDQRPNVPERGLLLIAPSEMNPAVARFDKLGLTVLFHAAGDEAVHAALDAIEYARKTNGPKGPRHQIGHSTFIAREDIARPRALGATIEFSPYLWSPSPINDDITKAVGPERIERVWPLREGIAAGGLVVAGSDWAVIPKPDPWLAIETSVTRRIPGGTGGTFGGEEAITVKQAIDMFTINAARQMGVEDRLGSIVSGYQADLIVIDRDPFAIPVTDIHNVVVEATYVAGEKVFDRAAMSASPKR